MKAKDKIMKKPVRPSFFFDIVIIGGGPTGLLFRYT